jgi:hypothetical protein
MKKVNSVNNKEIFEFSDLIRKEKQEALLNFNKEAFRSRLIRRIEEEPKKPSPFLFRFRRPVIAVSAVLVLVVMGWIAFQVFIPTPSERNARAIEKMLTRAFESQEPLISRSVPQVEPIQDESDIHEFEWSLKRVVYSAQREDIADNDVPRILSQVLQNAPQVREVQDEEPSGTRSKSEDLSLFKKSDSHQMRYRTQD